VIDGILVGGEKHIMYKIIGADQKEYGPSSAEELRQWVREGRADGRSLVQAEGSTGWKPLASFPELASALAESPFAAAPPRPPAATPPPMPVDSGVPLAQMAAGETEFRIGVCLSRGWSLLMSNYGLLFFATVSVFLMQVLLAQIPFIGVLALLLAGVFQGGVYVLFLKCLRGQRAGAGDAFSGFGELFVQLLLVGIVSTLFTISGLCCFALPGIYLAVAWTFAVPLVVDKQLRFWDAMELSRKVVTKHWFQILALIVLAFLPAIIFTLIVKLETIKYVWSMVQSGQLDPSLFTKDPAAYSVQLEKAQKLVAAKYLVQNLIEQSIWVVIQPFARAVLIQASEILFNPRSAPPA
jgi:hypothetical protein